MKRICELKHQPHKWELIFSEKKLCNLKNYKCSLCGKYKQEIDNNKFNGNPKDWIGLPVFIKINNKEDLPILIDKGYLENALNCIEGYYK